MIKYYAEFEFQTHASAVYWFPVQVVAEDEAAAQGICDAVLRSLNDEFRKASCSGLLQVHGPFKSILLNRYKALGRKGSTGSLDLNIWTMNENDDVINIQSEIDIAVSGDDSLDSAIYATVRQVRIPIQQLARPVHNKFEGSAFIVKVILNTSDTEQPEQTDVT
jgi:hypothetical protein